MKHNKYQCFLMPIMILYIAEKLIILDFIILQELEIHKEQNILDNKNLYLLIL